MLAELLLRQIPAHLEAGVESGQFKVYGSIVKSLLDGRIVGHLQETKGLGDLLAQAGSGLLDLTPAGMALKSAELGLDVVGHGVSYVQNEQIKAAVAAVQGLQVANLAVSAASIGVSVAGFAILSAKIGRVSDKVDAMGDRLDSIARGVEQLKRDRIDEDLIRLRTAAQQLDEAWSLADPNPQWRRVADETIFLANRFEHRAAAMLGVDADPIAAEPFLEAMALAANARVQARLASGDDAVARRAAHDGAAAAIRLGDRLALGDAVLARMRALQTQPGTTAWTEALNDVSATLGAGVKAARAREAGLASTALTLDELARRGIAGRAWLEAARAETDAPLLFLPAFSPH